MKKQYLFVPAENARDYKDYLLKRNIEFKQCKKKLNKTLKIYQICFIIPANLRPHTWKLLGPN